MQCLDDVAVLDYLESRMSLGAIADVRHHLDGCAACLSLVRQLAPTAKPAPAVDGLTLGRTISSGGMGLIVEAWDGKLERKISTRPRRAEAARQYRAAIAALEPFVDPKLGDPHVASEVAEAKWKLSKIVTGAERTRLVREAIATLQALERSKRLAPDRAKLLAQMRK